MDVRLSNLRLWMFACIFDTAPARRVRVRRARSRNTEIAIRNRASSFKLAL